ncbi:ABC transporter substrate-binding protein [Nocardioides alcanivorans]|uniref:ABC transporter substrate-binding protein n=1 Tax=Nocardioides alcanivorans TaxID=2897352 RepID=UPI001F1A89C1|nr:ABC transporter substrate-binding protein [Nocardioides alcanivorans]
MKRIPALAVAACLALTAACGSSGGSGGGSGDPDPDAVLRYTTSAGATSFDPHKTVAASDFIVLNLVYDRLVHQDVDGQPVPGLAESWEFSDDFKTLTFHLREGLSFEDGTAFDAEAAKANLDRAREPDSISASLLSDVDSVDVVDESTVQLNLSAPGVHLVLTLSDLAGMMVSPQAFATPDAAKALATDSDGIGRFTLGESDPGSHYVFEAVDDYWDKDALKLAGLEFSVATDPQTNLNAVASDQADCALVSPAMIAPAEQIAGATTKARTVLTQTVLYFNQTKSEFDDPLVRRAINLALDRDAILEGAQEGKGEASTGLFPNDYFVSNDSVADLVATDRDAARDLLEQAGLPNGFSFTAVTLTIPQFVTTAEIIKSQLKEIGIEMEIKALPPADMGINFLKGTGDAVITAWTGRPDPAMLFSAYFDEAAPQNVSRVEPEGFDEALAAANAIDDVAARGEALAAVQKLVLEEGAVVPVTFNQVGTVCNDRVTGYEPTVVGISEFRGVGMTN